MLRNSLTICLAGLGLSVVTSGAVAADPPAGNLVDTARGLFGVDVDVNDGVRVRAGLIDIQVGSSRNGSSADLSGRPGKGPWLFQGSRMIRTPVMDASHHEIGHVDDVVLDLRTGAVRYFAIAYPVENGRTKLFAVPRERFRLVHHDEGGFYFVVDIDKSVFTRAPGFLPGEWPNFANRRWLDEVDVFYGVYVKPGDVKTRFGTSPDPVRAIEHLVRVSRIEGLPVIDDDSEYRIGEVADVIVDLSRGSVRYGVVRFDHPSEDLDRRFAIPWRLLDYEIEDGRVCLELEVAQRELHQAPTFDAARWPDLLNPQFSQELDRFYSRIDD